MEPTITNKSIKVYIVREYGDEFPLADNEYLKKVIDARAVESITRNSELDPVEVIDFITLEADFVAKPDDLNDNLLVSIYEFSMPNEMIDSRQESLGQLRAFIEQQQVNAHRWARFVNSEDDLIDFFPELLIVLKQLAEFAGGWTIESHNKTIDECWKALDPEVKQMAIGWDYGYEQFKIKH